MNSALSFKISFSQDKKTKLFFLRFGLYTPLFIYNIYSMCKKKIFHDLNVDNFSKKNNAIGEPTSQVITNWDTTKGTTLGQRGATRDKSHWTEV